MAWWFSFPQPLSLFHFFLLSFFIFLALDKGIQAMASPFLCANSCHCMACLKVPHLSIFKCGHVNVWTRAAGMLPKRSMVVNISYLCMFLFLHFFHHFCMSFRTKGHLMHASSFSLSIHFLNFLLTLSETRRAIFCGNSHFLWHQFLWHFCDIFCDNS